jgi:hypothetical protein
MIIYKIKIGLDAVKRSSRNWTLIFPRNHKDIGLTINNLGNL